MVQDVKLYKTRQQVPCSFFTQHPPRLSITKDHWSLIHIIKVRSDNNGTNLLLLLESFVGYITYHYMMLTHLSKPITLVTQYQINSEKSQSLA